MAMPPCLVAIFDFDHTIIDANSDTLPFMTLAPEIFDEDIRNSSLPWTQRMDVALGKLPAMGVSAQEVLDCVSRAPLPSETRTAILLLRDSPLCVSAIVSDSNTLFIDAVLRANGLLDAFSVGIWTNPAKVVSAPDVGSTDTVRTRVSVSPHCASPDSRMCSCPSNMCKGQIVRDIMDRHSGAKFMYCGDGANDLCGVQQLPADSFALPRSGFKLARLLHSSKVAATVIPWETGADLLTKIELIVSRTTTAGSN